MSHEYQDAISSKDAGVTYHMAIAGEWEQQKDAATYVPSAFAADGFIHCTNGLELLQWVGSSFYKESGDPRIVLVLAIDEISSEVRYDDPDEHFPHIYGPLNTSAVIAELPVHRAPDGTFIGFGVR